MLPSPDAGPQTIGEVKYPRVAVLSNPRPRRACGLAGDAPAPPRQCCGGSGMPLGERGPVSVDAHESADEGGRPASSFAAAAVSLMYAALSLSTSASPACQSASSIGSRGAPVTAGVPPSPPARPVLPARTGRLCSPTRTGTQIGGSSICRNVARRAVTSVPPARGAPDLSSSEATPSLARRPRRWSPTAWLTAW